MSNIIIIDGLEYTASNKRLRYNPDYHDKHKLPWEKEDLLYLCGMWQINKVRDISLALGRTEGTCLSKIYELRKIGLYESYKKRFHKYN